MTDSSISQLKESQRRHISATCQYVDRALTDLEAVVAASSSGSPFARYVDDLTPAQKRLLSDYCAGIRAQMLRVLRGLGIAPGETMISARHAIRTGVAYVEIALEELKPRHMRGYGEVPPDIAPELNGLVYELQALVDRLDRALAHGTAADLGARLARLSEAGEGSDLLVALERVIQRQGLVEFRPALNAILERYEDRRFEVAVFGRVSSGKSSLLNRLLGADILPVGVTPMTAVPTRIQFGPARSVELRFADRPAERVGLERLAEYVTEQANPDNVKHVTRVVVTLDQPQLAQGVVFVDTPGLGSMAAAGAAETLAYLPRCDLGVVLVDGSTSLTPDDVSTVARLSEAGIPPMVLLSKADVLTPDEVTRVVAYVRDQFQKALGLALTVHPVSAAPDHTDRLDAWMAQTLQPLLADHRSLVVQSLQRKVGVLRVSVEATLRARLGREKATPPVAWTRARSKASCARRRDCSKTSGTPARRCAICRRRSSSRPGIWPRRKPAMRWILLVARQRSTGRSTRPS
jgi:GTP-binding protein EngB required for normal cell division